MAYNQELTDRVRALLATQPTVEERKMFGSIGFKVRGKLCLGVGDHPDHVMMVRVGLANYATALQQQGASPAVMRGSERKGYVFLKLDAVKNDKQLQYWVDLALAYNKALTA